MLTFVICTYVKTGWCASTRSTDATALLRTKIKLKMIVDVVRWNESFIQSHLRDSYIFQGLLICSSYLLKAIVYSLLRDQGNAVYKGTKIDSSGFTVNFDAAHVLTNFCSPSSKFIKYLTWIFIPITNR